MSIIIAPKKPKTSPIEKVAVSAKEASLMLSVSERTLYNWAKQGKLKTRRIGGRVLYSLESLRKIFDDDSADNSEQ